MNFSEMRVGNVFSFNTYNSNVLGGQHTQMRLSAPSDYAIASTIDSGLAEKHVAVHASLPAGTTKDATKLSYLIFTDANGRRVVFAYEWLINESIQSTQYTHLDVKIKLAGIDQQSAVLAYLAAGGFSVVQSSLS